jgi:hypothetical protein
VVPKIAVRERKRSASKAGRLDKPAIPAPRLIPLAISTPMFGNPITIGSVDSADWLRARGITTGNLHWFVEVALGTEEESSFDTWLAVDTRFHVYIYPAEWGYLFCHDGRASWIRVADRAYVHHRDDYSLVGSTPPLRDISELACSLERRHRMAFQRDRVQIRTNLSDIETSVRGWVAQL